MVAQLALAPLLAKGVPLAAGALKYLPVIGAVVSVPMSIIGAYFYYTYDKKN